MSPAIGLPCSPQIVLASQVKLTPSSHSFSGTLNGQCLGKTYKKLI